MVSLNTRPASPAPDIEGLEREQIKEAIEEWFYANFENPVENTPFESAEGGYQYIWGGPYDAREEIENHFVNLPEDLIEEVVSELEREAVEWALSTNRIFDEDPRDDPELTSYEELQLRLDDLERAVARVEPHSSLIGSNHPPENIGVPPYADEDKAEIQKAIEALRKPEDEIAKEPVKAVEAAAILKSRGEKLQQFFARHGDKFVESFASQLGKRAADSLAVAFWLKLAGALIAAYEAATWLLQSIGAVPVAF